MSNTQGEPPLTRSGKIVTAIGIAAVTVVIAAIGIGVGTAAHAAQVQADAAKAMTEAAPAYQGAIDLGGDLDALSVKAVQAKAAYDAEQARLAAEKAAQEAAAAAQAAAEAAAQEAAARQAAEQQATSSSHDSGDDTSSPPASGGKLPAGSPVPWIPNPDPQDTAGGRWDTSACASGSASGNPAVCD